MGTRDDGVLQIRAGDVIVVSYYDNLNDFGSEQEVADQAVYGGWAGGVSGTWTIDNSPYVVTGDIYLSGDLTIEPGVEVLFFGDYGFSAHDYDFIVNGMEDSSVYFGPLNEGGVWRGIRKYWGGATLSYLNVSNANEYGLYLYYNNNNIYITDSKFSNNRYGIYIGEQYNENTSIVIDNCEFNNNTEWGVQGSSNIFSSEVLNDCPFILSNSTFSNNNHGLYVGHNTSVCAEYNTIENNSYIGVYLRDEQPNFSNIKFHYNNIHDNGGNYDNYDVETSCCGGNNSHEEFDFRFNYWGEDTTNEMNEGDNPKNISRIYDWGENKRKKTKCNRISSG